MIENHPLVSVIIPVYNGDRYLAEALKSVVQQTYQPIEIIVVDDGSTDNSANIALSYKEVRYIYQSNQGVAVARNVGISQSRGEFIALLDQDDRWTPNKLSIQIKYLLEHENIGYTLAKMRVFLEPGTEKPSWLKAEYLSEDIPGYILGLLVARKSIFEKVGNLNPNYKFGNDSDWFFRANDVGIPMVILPETLLYKRVHGANESHKIQSMTADMLKLVRSSIQRKRAHNISKHQ
ncbi:glycosyltransferase family 2 protein [Limnofasciculus baicalensis]|uniref:Glycosyltransferase family 2 protein n=1 Tax=Limnofasciculus baicalensis BBK-W-15 TaxID=2699891 RepID=A0AAE3GNP3_9CYAN|nr:glycosyltransferase family A protein [Limnofasciculus baicalensis]MCP2727284.1 glycosyltransferase family 2 protein [Limnofasciculus baicalensis BBK-W-15]